MAKHFDTYARWFRHGATTYDDKIGATRLHWLVVVATVLLVIMGTHQLPGGGVAAAPAIPAVSSSLAPQAAAMSRRESVSSEG